MCEIFGRGRRVRRVRGETVEAAFGATPSQNVIFDCSRRFFAAVCGSSPVSDSDESLNDDDTKLATLAVGWFI